MDELLSAVEEAQTLGYFKSFCDKNCSPSAKQRIRNIISRASNKSSCIKGLFKNEINVDLTDSQTDWMLSLVTAFINKSTYRKAISDQTKVQLLKSQTYKCNICNATINIHAHADHIVPFKYVGDELNENHNLQMLCSKCNEAKNASIDYQIKYLLKLV
ncbi:HNH endonuclease [Butyrivibrio sp. AE3009]|uniref:HNH endonuclease n=1 Tax=Butyrivibrio sp. AE3009 TaxID=1280666 RepID=UPI0003B633AE|nr:HNH endonuclease [Butyrivibrio sp. AE3009]